MPFVDKDGNLVRLPVEVDPPARVAIVGLGYSAESYIRAVDIIGDRHTEFDETWTFNSFGELIQHDRLFVMDDVRLLMRDGTVKSKGILETLKRHPGPVYTGVPHPDYPCLVPYPLEFVINNAGYDYLNNVAAYAIAFAIAIGVKKMTLFGIDFLPMDSHDAPEGRECCEYWVGRAMQRGIEVIIARQSRLLSASQRMADPTLFYGYETKRVEERMVLRTVKDKDGNEVERPYCAVSFSDRPESEWPQWRPPREKVAELTAEMPAE